MSASICSRRVDRRTSHERVPISLGGPGADLERRRRRWADVPPGGAEGAQEASAGRPADYVHRMSWQWPAGAACGFVIAVVTTPAGVSGAVLLLPVQLTVLGVPSPAVTPTNLLFNVVAVPGGLLRFWRERRLWHPLSALLIAGTLPGVVAGAVIRVQYLSGQRAFMFIAAGVLMPLGLWLLLGSQRMAPARREPGRRGRALICVGALGVGVVGGIYGVGGGSLLAPVLIASGFSVYEVAPATLLATFLTSIAGIATYEVLQVTHGGSVAPEWILGVCTGLGGFAGSYAGARLQSRLPEASLRRLLGLVACVVAARYLQTAGGSGQSGHVPTTRRASAGVGRLHRDRAGNPVPACTDRTAALRATTRRRRARRAGETCYLTIWKMRSIPSRVCDRPSWVSMKQACTYHPGLAVIVVCWKDSCVSGPANSIGADAISFSSPFSLPVSRSLTTCPPAFLDLTGRAASMCTR